MVLKVAGIFYSSFFYRFRKRKERGIFEERVFSSEIGKISAKINCRFLVPILQHFRLKLFPYVIFFIFFLLDIDWFETIKLVSKIYNSSSNVSIKRKTTEKKYLF